MSLTQFINDCMSGDLEAINNRFQIDPNFINHITDQQNAGLSAAIQHRRYPVVTRLLGYAQVQEVIAADNNKLLREAVQAGRLDIVNALLAFDAVTDILDIKPLKLATFSNNRDVFFRLLDYPKIRQAIPNDAHELLRSALFNGDLEMLQRLFEFPSIARQITFLKDDAASHAIFSGIVYLILNKNIPAVNYLLQFTEILSLINKDILNHISWVDTLAQCPNAIIAAIQCNNTTIVGQISMNEFGAQHLADNHNQAIRIAIQNGRTLMVSDFLLNERVTNNIADITNFNNSALMCCASIGNALIFHWLLQYKEIAETITNNDNCVFRAAVDNIGNNNNNSNSINNSNNSNSINNSNNNNNNPISYDVQMSNKHQDIIDKLLKLEQVRQFELNRTPRIEKYYQLARAAEVQYGNTSNKSNTNQSDEFHYLPSSNARHYTVVYDVEKNTRTVTSVQTQINTNTEEAKKITGCPIKQVPQ